MRVPPAQTKMINRQEVCAISRPKASWYETAIEHRRGSVVFSPCALAARAGLSKQERDSAKKMTAGTLYLRLVVPRS
jgi:hypothetical protein